MTIKRRLFISNILMIVLPMIMTIAMANALFILYVNITGVDPFEIRNANITFVNTIEVDKYLHEYDYTQLSNSIAAYQTNAGGYVIVLPDNMDKLIKTSDKPPYYIPLLMLLFILVVVVLTNYTLTKYIAKSINSSIEILSTGVHEISEGNLTYRIQYNKNDEFNPVCTDFNEMALRLSDMVAERQKDEDNRKELIAGISHDLRTPLTSIKAYIEGLRKGIASTPEKREKYLDTIQSKTENIEYIITQLFMFSKIDIGEFPLNFENVDIGNELEKIVCGLTDEYKEGGLSISLAEKVKEKFVSIDTVQFRNVIQNILDNAMKYCKNENAHVDIFCHSNENHIIIKLKDNGAGVPEEMLTKLFDVFYRSDVSRNNPSKGSGLGLAISSKIIERLHGSISAKNVPEGGLGIIITLPLIKGV